VISVANQIPIRTKAEGGPKAALPNL